MPRIALGIEYDGTEFVGWQTQQDGRSIESTVAAAVGTVANERVTVHAAGRTDAGVHALNQVAHFDSGAQRSTRQWLLGINSNLPPDVAIRWVKEVPDDFDARRSALWRRYRYWILEQPARPALARSRVWWLDATLDCAAMTAAAVHWLGEHDFAAFRAAGCQARTSIRRLMSVEISRKRDGDSSLLALEFKANAFLQHMVRNLVGLLSEIGRERAAPAAAAQALASRDRTQAGVAAPPNGLYLIEVGYPDRFALPRPAGRGAELW